MNAAEAATNVGVNTGPAVTQFELQPAVGVKVSKITTLEKDLALALRGASDDVKERILANMSQRAGETLREEMEYMPPQRRRTIEEAQTKIVAVVRRLEDAGAIFVARGGEGNDEEVVV